MGCQRNCLAPFLRVRWWSLMATGAQITSNSGIDFAITSCNFHTTQHTVSGRVSAICFAKFAKNKIWQTLRMCSSTHIFHALIICLPICPAHRGTPFQPPRRGTRAATRRSVRHQSTDARTERTAISAVHARRGRRRKRRPRRGGRVGRIVVERRRLIGVFSETCFLCACMFF